MALRTKLAIWFSIFVTVILILISSIRYAGNKQIIQNQKDNSLKFAAYILYSLTPQRVPSEADIKKIVSRIYSEYPDLELNGLLIKIYEPSGSLIFTSSSSEAERFPMEEAMWNDLYTKET